MKCIEEKLALNENITTIFCDVDGVVKDLYLEHTLSIEELLKKIKVSNCKKRIISTVDIISKAMISCGVFPTNSKMQRLLIYSYGILLNQNPVEFYEEYKRIYATKNCMFENVVGKLISLSKSYDIVFVSMNKQSKNIDKYGLANFEILISQNSKYKLMKDLMLMKGISPIQLLIIGDNFLHDYIPAKLLGCDIAIVNCYESKLKESIRKTAL